MPDTAASGVPVPSATRRADELATLNAVAEALNRSPSLDAALTRTLELVAEALGLHSGWLWLENERGEFALAAIYNLPPVLQDPENMTGWHCLCLRAFLEGSLRGAANINVLECSRLEDVREGTNGLLYHATAPIYLGGRRIGVMNVAMPQWRRLDAEDLRFLHTIGYQVGLAVENSRLLDARARLAQAEERGRIAREIHDTVAQQLAGLALQLEAAAVLLDSDPARGRRTVEGAAQLARAALDDARRSVLDLRAAPLEGLALSEALLRLVAEFGRDHAVKAAFKQRGDARPLAPRVELAVYRVAQEALTNIARHASARRVTVALDTGKAPAAPVRLVVQDDGRGFDSSAPPPDGTHVGLSGMRERARLLGGRLDIASTPGKGARLTLELPGTP
jgi:two-component system, NarL family, sensor kinase